MDNSNLEEYGQIKREMKALDTRLKEIKPHVELEITASLGGEPGEADLPGVGKFVLYNKRTYLYSDETTASVNSIKEQKKIEEQDGTATYEEKLIMKFTEEK